MSTIRRVLSLAGLLSVIFAGSVRADGACCFRDGHCEVLSQSICIQMQGIYQGDNFPCTPNPCPQPPINDTCASAIPVPRCANGTMLGTTYLAVGNYDPGEPWPSCTGSHEYGPDVVYRFDLFRGDVLNVTLYPFRTDAGIYLVTDCSDVHGSCVAGADFTLYAQPEYLNYSVLTTGSYYLIIDGFYQYAAGEFQLDYQMQCSTVEAPAAEAHVLTPRLSASPTPFRTATTLRCSNAPSEQVSFELFDSAGRRVRVLDSSLGVGRDASAVWDGRDEAGRAVPAGLYFARLSSGSSRATQVLVKID
ncbi:MAG: T9SS type A sorting domain-containing protein [Candidatus Eisenbacteria bacterium]